MSFPRYERYKDSGVEWLGEVPEEWAVKSIKRFISQSNAGEVIDKSYWGGDAEVMYSCAIEPFKCDYIGFPEWKRTTVNDLLLTRNGTPYVHIPVANALYSNVVQRIVLHEGICREFVATALQHSAKNLQGYGVSIESLNYEMWKELSIAEPSYDEQFKIVAFLRKETSKIDTLIAEQQKLIELLKEKRQAVISHAVTKGLNPQVKMKDSGVEWLGEVPEHWVVCSLGYLSKIKTGATPDRGKLEFWGGDIPWLKTGEINYQPIYGAEEFITEAGLANSAAQISEPGTLLMAMYGQGITRGRVAVLKISATYNQACAAISFGSRVYEEFARYYFMAAYSFIRDFGNETSQMNLSSSLIGKFKMAIPPRPEQSNIVSFLNSEMDRFDQLMDQAQKAISLLQERRSALISAAVTGKIDLRKLS